MTVLPTLHQPKPAVRQDDWSVFRAINERRRAIREFDGRELEEDDVRAILGEALLAPSSGNLQGYTLHWVRDPHKKAALAAACNGQRAAATASALVVMVVRVRTAFDVLEKMEAYIEHARLEPRSKDYHRGHVRKFRRILRYAPFALWAPFKAMLDWVFPIFTLLPVGSVSARHWFARNGLLAAQTLLLAASARGIDSCPMEGFQARRVAKLLELPRDAVIPVVIALGRRAPSARVEPRWRRSLDDVLVVH